MKKKILVLFCHGGGGHISAANSIKAYLEPNYTIILKDALGSVLAPMDPTYYITFKQKTGQDIYNFLLRNNHKRLTNLLYTLGNAIIQWQKKSIKKLFIRYFDQEKPDLIISVIPIINNAILGAAQHHNIPYLLVPTDLDLTTFLTDVSFEKTIGTTLCLGLDYPEIRQTINADRIDADTITVTGFPLGPQFFEHKNKEALKKQFSIDPAKPVVLLMMGATGSPATISYIRALSLVKKPFHLMACAGRNKKLKEKILATKLPASMSLTVVDTSHDISDIMAIADICITKSGSVTFAEALYMNLPMLLDKTTPALRWEALNFTFLKQHKLGEIITNLAQVPDLVTHYISYPSLLAILKNNSIALEKKDFGSKIREIVTIKML